MFPPFPISSKSISEQRDNAPPEILHLTQAQQTVCLDRWWVSVWLCFEGTTKAFESTPLKELRNSHPEGKICKPKSVIYRSSGWNSRDSKAQAFAGCLPFNLWSILLKIAFNGPLLCRIWQPGPSHCTFQYSHLGESPSHYEEDWSM